mmetsp:Transcript_62440/g.103870  ORF Transcript_62440/g.103870 Transcript_62440/m.103870 type:complete len:278 (-) Transcript_62440:163-996(-)
MGCTQSTDSPNEVPSAASSTETADTKDASASFAELHQAMMREQSQHAFVTLLRDNPTALSATNGEGQTLLHAAAERGCLSACRTLLEHGVKSNSVDQDGQTALHLAVANGHLKCAYRLTQPVGIQCCIELGMEDKYKMTPLHIAAENGEIEMVQLLLARGAMSSFYRPSCKNLLKEAENSQKAETSEAGSPRPAAATRPPPRFSSDDTYRGFAKPTSPEFDRKALLKRSQHNSGGTAAFIAESGGNFEMAEVIRRADRGEKIELPDCLLQLHSTCSS